MTPLLVPLGAALMVVLGAVAGPTLIRRASPALARVPRTALVLLLLAGAAWLLLLLSLGPLLAWSMSGPALALVPDGAAQVCQRCLAAASPFGNAGLHTAVPAVLLLITPLLLSGAIALRLATRWHALKRQARDLAAEVVHTGRPHRVGGTTVQVIESPDPLAFALPGRRSPIVLSTTTLRELGEPELRAVVAHERAHRAEHHHAIGFLSRELAALLPFVPLLRAVADAVPHYLEISADAAAVRQVGTSPLAAALLRLGEHPVAVGSMAPSGGLALHAAGPGRVRQLLAPEPARHGATAVTGFGLGLGGSVVTVMFVAGSYLVALLTGCA
jgi:Zn-dependent protease with chaperone function